MYKLPRVIVNVTNFSITRTNQQSNDWKATFSIEVHTNNYLNSPTSFIIEWVGHSTLGTYTKTIGTGTNGLISYTINGSNLPDNSGTGKLVMYFPGVTRGSNTSNFTAKDEQQN